MSLPSPMQVFESSLPAAPPPAPAADMLDALIRQKLQDSYNTVLTSNPVAPMPLQGPSPTDLVNGMGDYLVRTASVWAKLTENFAAGEHVSQAVSDVCMRSERRSHLADVSEVVDLDITLEKLRKIQNLTAQYSREVQAIWCPEVQEAKPSTETQVSATPFYGKKPLSIQQTLLTRNESKSRPRRPFAPANVRQEQAALNDDESGSDGSDDDDDELFQDINLDSLKSRGKGEHYCPKRYECTKGGLDENGALVAFVRNSAYLQHCNKHIKPWRCEKPYCPNPPKKRKFARRDGLERHQASVNHKPPEAKSPRTGKARRE